MQVSDKTVAPEPKWSCSVAEVRRLQSYYDSVTRCLALYEALGHSVICDTPENRSHHTFIAYFAATDLFHKDPEAARKALDQLCEQLEGKGRSPRSAISLVFAH